MIKSVRLLCSMVASAFVAFSADAAGPVAKAVVLDAGKTLRFVYDSAGYGTKNTDWYAVSEAEDTEPTGSMPWEPVGATVERVEFHPSFQHYAPYHCGSWFYNFTKLRHVAGLYVLDVSHATSLACMFGNCRALASVDLSHWDTRRVEDMHRMFDGCSSLTTILAHDTFTTAAVTEGEDMFRGCTSLVGGEGTAYAADRTSSAYARIDYYNGGARKRGFFTCAGVPVAVLSDAGRRLTFYCDTVDHSDQGLVFSLYYDYGKLNNGRLEFQDPPWNDCRVNTTSFDASFSAFRPVSCHGWFRGVRGCEHLDVLQTGDCVDFGSMFQECNYLTSVDLHAFDTSRAEDMSYMFDACLRLHTLDLQNFDTSRVRDMSFMFWACRADSLDVGSFNTSSVTNMDGMFKQVACDTLDLSGFDTSHVANMARLFAHSNLRSVDLSSLNTSNVTSMAYMFSECEYLQSLDLSGFDTSKVEDMSYMFQGCLMLRDVNLAGFDTSRVTNMHSMFHECANLTRLDVSAFDTSRVKDMTLMFSMCSNLKTLDLSSFRFGSVDAMKMGYFAAGCARLASLDISGLKLSNVGSLWAYRAFSDCENLKRIYVSDDFDFNSYTHPVTDYNIYSQNILEARFNRDVFKGSVSLVGAKGTTYDSDEVDKNYGRVDASGRKGYFSRPSPAVAVYSASAKTLTFYRDGADHASEGTVYSVAVAEAQTPARNPPWYDACHGTVTRVVFDSSFADYAPKHCGSWFYGFTSLATFEGLEYLDVSRADSLMYMFARCSSLTMLDLRTFDTARATNMDYLFSGCSALERIAVSDAFTTNALERAATAMFQSCTSLVGGGGTAYSAAHQDSTYARYDLPDVPGYFVREAVAVYSSSDATLTFYADGNAHEGDGTVYSVTAAECLETASNPPWYDACHMLVTNVVFDPSFASYRPRHCGSWFYAFTALTSVSGLENLDLSRTTSLKHMFNSCKALRTLDIRSWDTSYVKDMDYLFRGCSALTTIYATDRFSTASLTGGGLGMFTGDSALKGGCGTAYDSAHTSAEYARCDRADTPGYLTAIAAKAVYSAGQGTLTFYYDGKDHAQEGTVYSVAEAEAQDPSATPPWYVRRTSVTRVVFDQSFADYRPRHCGCWFKGFSALTAVWGLGWLNVSEATSLNEMFSGCSSLMTLDLTGFVTGNVTSLYHMVYNCSALQTIYASPAFTTTALTQMNESVFASCTSLRGGNGTAYGGSRVSAVYARLDESGKAGYFSAKPTAVAVYSSSDATLTFYCDYKNHAQEGKVYPIDAADALENGEDAPWFADCHLNVTRVVFDNSFAACRPRRCAGWFSRFRVLEKIVNLPNLNLSETVDLMMMFDRCDKLEELDFTDLDTHCVTNMRYMINRCTALKTIWSSTPLATDALSTSGIVFNYCPQLTGGNGTQYDGSRRSAEYARVDAKGSPGYFTDRLPVAVCSWDGQTLTFYCDGTDHAKEGTPYLVRAADGASTTAYPAWRACADTVTHVKFDISFGNYRPRHCSHWFDGFAKLTRISNLANLDVSRATSLRFMFAGCAALETLGLESFDTARVTDMMYMFDNCTALKTVTVSEAFTTAGIANKSDVVFDECPALVGGNGTAYSSAKRAATYACIDTAQTPGYFTSARRAVAVYAGRTLTFHYDTVDHSGEGIVYPVAKRWNNRGYEWDTYSPIIETVVFAPSFADYHPTSCAGWFAEFGRLHTVSGMENLNVSAATSFARMFAYCSSLETLDLSHFDTRNATSFREMFLACHALTTILASEQFKVRDVDTWQPMFANCTKLVGGNGTRYWDLASPASAQFACIDAANPGYFTCVRPVAVYTPFDATLTFYCDARFHGGFNRTQFWLRDAEMIDPKGSLVLPWFDLSEDVERVVFDNSFASYRPKHCAGWFSDFMALSEIEGLPNLNVSEATSLREMFLNCEQLTSLELSGFDTARVTDMGDMFASCANLETIYASKRFVTGALEDPEQDLFEGCYALAGGNGTECDDDHKSAVYARRDTGKTPGLFTEKIARVCYEQDWNGLVFYYDANTHDDATQTWLVEESEEAGPYAEAPWLAGLWDCEYVYFDSSFAEYRPSHCGHWFSEGKYIKEIDGLEYLNVSVATNLNAMFGSCVSLTDIDLSTFHTRNVTDMDQMFRDCTSLRTIYASETFTRPTLNTSGGMFANCQRLVGGCGTAFASERNADAQYACLDSAKTPGYFTEEMLWHRQPKAVVNGTTMTFCCDEKNYGESEQDKTWYLVQESEAIDALNDAVAWEEAWAPKIETVVFDPTFADYSPTNCGSWFNMFTNLQRVVGIENLDISKVRMLAYMFNGCRSLPALDLAEFDGRIVTNAYRMFGNCSQLKAIYAGDRFDLSSLSGGAGAGMFTGCTSLMGGNGTAYATSLNSSAYARLDRPGQPGYFMSHSDKMAKAVVQGKSLEFRYDREMNEYAECGKTWYRLIEAERIDARTEDVPWSADWKDAIDTVTFVPSFADYRPAQCGSWFGGFKRLGTVSGLENLDVSQATSLAYMFADCGRLKELNLASFDTCCVTDTCRMFANCSNLVRIVASDRFNVASLTSSQGYLMFYNCLALAGGNGTSYLASHVGSEYARIDKPGTPGYFTLGAPTGGFAAWAAAQGLTGADAAWDAKPALWGGKWANAFIYTYGEGLADGSLAIMTISFGPDAKPIITTAPVVEGHDDFTATVVGASTVEDWTAPVVLEREGDDWKLPTGASASFFKVKLAK